MSLPASLADRSKSGLGLAVVAVTILAFLGAPELSAQERSDFDGEVPAFHEYDPPSTLVVPETEVVRAKYPFVDVHSHQWGMPDADLVALAAEMDALNMAVMVNLSGRGFRRAENADGSFRLAYQPRGYLKRGLEAARAQAPGRFLVFTNLDLEGIEQPDWRERTLRQLEDDARAGAAGLKIYKSLGLDSRDGHGERIAVNDPRLDPVWAKCGELGLVVLIHAGEPASFWHPKDRTNERLLEMMERPERWRGDPERYVSFETVMGEQHDIFRRHPKTRFINAHFGWLASDLAALGRLLDEMPNVYTEFGAVIAELGRQPRFARKWLIEYQDRVLFGKDTWRPSEYPLYFRVLESDDDYIEYFRRRHAFWRLYGLALPDETLKKIYYQNALRLFPQIDRSLFPE